ncbi:2-oxoacid:ferredoxin oxidoreductase subunit beta [archaeon]|nr:2-oxoacid:ferredoxin oxidoreductase subunit beta [archaeon]
MKSENYFINHKSQWCPGCGNFPILSALKKALAKLNIKNENAVVVSGIGCSGKIPHYLKTYGFEGVHGRVLPVATGVKLSNNDLTVIGCAGDGDGYGIGGNHLIHAMRRNIDITYIVHNNQIYGLTTGQVSPTTSLNFKSKTTPFGNIENPLNPLSIALSSGATFVSRGFSGRLDHLVNLIVKGIKHKGFSLIDVFQPCVSFNYLNTYDWFEKRIYDLQKTKHNTNDLFAAHKKTLEENKLPIGILYQIKKPTYDSLLPQIKKQSLVKQNISKVNINPLLKELE